MITEENKQTSDWASVLSIAIGAFVIVTTEFLPIGLLTPIRKSLNVTEGEISWAVTLTGIIAAMTAPLCPMLIKSYDRKKVLVFLSFIVVASNLLAGLAPNFTSLMIARAALGITVGGFWTFGLAVGRKLVTEEYGNRATAIISAGISLGIVFGLPIGTTIGQFYGWRGAFFFVAVLSFLAAIAQIFFLPTIKSLPKKGSNGIWGAFHIPMARSGLIINIFIFCGHFVAYTFLEPYIRLIPGMTETGLSVMLLYYGIAAFAGNFIAEWAIKRIGLKQSFFISIAIMSGIILLESFVSNYALISIAAIGVWGILFSGFAGVYVPVWMFNASPERFEENSALMVSTAQIGVAAGATLGGVLVDSVGLKITFVIAALVTALGAAVIHFSKEQKGNLQAKS
ncbi:MFS transporter [Sphingobacterium sp. 18053]|uniref:MFS transporter n=1 Tax=Sphingobacterium sp. 18053 TaxID=2681401 RepID=UPI001359E753|nr:MFS transporter [Sphingobacterium sp. 18053]